MRVALLVLALVSSLVSAEEVEMWSESNGNRLLLEDTSIRNLGSGYVSAFGFMYTNGERVKWTYMVNGCAYGYGSVTFGRTDAATTEIFYWARQGNKNGDGLARFMCLRGAGKQL